jgi:hypothetical protein
MRKIQGLSPGRRGSDPGSRLRRQGRGMTRQSIYLACLQRYKGSQCAEHRLRLDGGLRMGQLWPGGLYCRGRHTESAL